MAWPQPDTLRCSKTCRYLIHGTIGVETRSRKGAEKASRGPLDTSP
jgi:hypothetical protein